MSSRYFAIVPAAGSGKRMGGALPKQYLPLLDKTILEWSLEALLHHARIEKVAIVLAADDRQFARTALAQNSRVKTATGGVERADSVYAGLNALAGEAAPEDWILVHDAARPCLSAADLQALMDGLAEDPIGGLLAVPLSDTLKQANELQRVAATLPREHVWRALTPQMFRFGLLKRALEAARKSKLTITDEAMAIENLGHAPRLILGRADNIKITRPEDLVLAKNILQDRVGAGALATFANQSL